MQRILDPELAAVLSVFSATSSLRVARRTAAKKCIEGI